MGDKGLPTSSKPTRKRQGIFEDKGEKRQRFEAIAPERELSGVVANGAEGQSFSEFPAEGQAKLTDAGRKSDGNGTQTDDKHCTVFLLDIFSGTAGVAASFIQLGGDALGLDHMVDRKRMRGPISKTDLCKKETQDQVISWLEQNKVDAVMLAPPCGTSSRAREIPVFESGRKRAAPQPLRSKRWPNGIPSLRGVSALKVKLANKLYAFTRRVIDTCVRLGIPFICENPQRSWMWDTTFFQNLPGSCRFQCIHSCMYGGQRLKKTALLLNFEANNLKLTCNGKHQHLPWGKTISPHTGETVFSTTTEAEYPWALCKQLAQAFAEQMRMAGKSFELPSTTMDVKQRMGAGTQPRGKLGPLLLAEFKHKVVVRSSQVCVPRTITEDSPAPFQGIPLHSKLISSRTEMVKGVAGDEEMQFSEFGVYYTPEEFLRMAATLQHPLDSPQLVDESNLRAMLAIRDWTEAQLAEFRTKNLRHYTKLAVDLMEDEKELRAGMDPQVNEVLRGKRLKLFQQMCADAGVADGTLFDELTAGFRLTGPMQASGQFPRRIKPATITVQQLRESSVWSKKMIYSSCKRVSSDPEIARAVFQETQQQLSDGWVKGPFTMQQMDERFGGCWIPSKRFGVRQGGKVRAVDDFSEFLVNASVTSTEKLALYGIDEVINTARFFMGIDAITFDCDGFPVLARCDSTGAGPWKQLQGRALDLKAAYKQLARHPDDAWAAVLAVWNPDSDSVDFFESVALPFGSVSAVMCFNRMARALRIIMSKLFLLVNTNFFDDFCQLEIPKLCKSAWDTAELVMQLLGWRISTSDDKRLPFATKFTMLGAVVDLSEMCEGKVVVCNKPSRLEDIAGLVADIVSKQKVPVSLVETLRGRLLYAAGHTFGRCTQLAIQLISKAVKEGPLVVIDTRTKGVILAALELLQSAGPRLVNAWTGTRPVLVFTDGACEQDGMQVSHGAVLVDFHTDTYVYFGSEVPEEWVSKWRSSGRVQLICQAEIFPVVVAKQTWPGVLSHRAVLWFIDNNSAQAALVRSYSPVTDNYELLVRNAELDVCMQTMNWYSRVPSKSNISDDPSRLCFTELDRSGYTRCEPCYDFTKVRSQKGVAGVKVKVL